MSHLPPAVPAADLTSCDREPIHTPGSIQPHGAMIVTATDGLRISHVSANLPAGLLDRSIDDVLGSETMSALRKLTGEPHGFSGTVSGRLPTPERPERDIVAHRFGDRIYVEFEPPGENSEDSTALAKAHAIVQSLRRTRSRQELCETVVREFKALTGFDRVMVYRFNAAGCGTVIAEAHEPELESYIDLRFPASDIPVQARRLYLQQRVRSIPDISYTPVPVRASPTETAVPLDMSHCHLRGVSPLHVEYLRNMGVGATLAISLVPDSELWGMLICHHRSPRRVSPGLRSSCDMIGQLMSLLIGVKGQNEFLAQRLDRAKLLKSISDRALEAEPLDAVLQDTSELLGLLQADGALVQIGSQARLVGSTPDLDDARAIVAAMRGRSAGEVVAVEALGETCPEFAHLAPVASGVLTMPILQGPEDSITWFRQEVTRTVTWGGNPEKATIPEKGRLTPRKSFAAWQNVVKGHSHAWTEVDHELAKDLRRIITGAMLRHLQMQAQLAHLRHYDALTGLPNRRLLEERVADCAEHRRPAAMVFLDLDRFKSVNDSLGHAVGDDLLVQVANRLIESVPAEHLVSRLGGDEFVVLCENAELPAAQHVADRVMKAFAAPFQLAGKPYRLSTSVGVAVAGAAQQGDVLRSADIAMYAAKRTGGNRAVIFDTELHQKVSEKFELEQDLHGAIERGELELHYQPIFRADTGQIRAFEALVRWRRGGDRLVPPGDFIPLAEETGLILPIGSWILSEGIRQAALWRERFERDILMSINVSGRQTARSDFPDEVAAALARHGLPPHALMLEATETILADDAAVRHLGAARQTGVRVAIDDFGTGYSSLASLYRLPLDKLKLDKLFLAQLPGDPRYAASVGALVQLAHALSLIVVAEGVENEQQWKALRTLGCDAGQGYWLGRPVPPHQAEALLNRSRSAIVAASCA